MIVVISGSNRPGNNSSVIAKSLGSMLVDAGEEVFPIDLEALPTELFTPWRRRCDCDHDFWERSEVKHGWTRGSTPTDFRPPRMSEHPSFPTFSEQPPTSRRHRASYLR